MLGKASSRIARYPRAYSGGIGPPGLVMFNEGKGRPFAHKQAPSGHRCRHDEQPSVRPWPRSVAGRAGFLALHNFSQPDCARLNSGQPVPNRTVDFAAASDAAACRAPAPRPDSDDRASRFLVLTFGWGRGIRNALRDSEAGCVVATSCLTVHQNLVIEQARRLEIPTVFITHAPIGRGQMPLTTDFAFLDGEFQRQQFPAAGTREA